MPIINRIGAFAEEMTAWRRDLHAHPEIAFEEHRTAEFVATKLAEWGIAVHRGLAGTGVVGTLSAGQGHRSIAIRADMDALPMPEVNDFAHRSTVPGKMHACGHDGHTSILLGAAKYLADTRNFDGTIHFIFQPAEENGGGADVMIREGLFEQFPVDAVYGLHNDVALPVGQASVVTGPVMAAADMLKIIGQGARRSCGPAGTGGRSGDGRRADPDPAADGDQPAYPGARRGRDQHLPVPRRHHGQCHTR